LTHTILVLVTVGLGHGIYGTLYTFIGGQRAEKFENHWCRQTSLAWKKVSLYSLCIPSGVSQVLCGSDLRWHRGPLSQFMLRWWRASGSTTRIFVPCGLHLSI